MRSVDIMRKHRPLVLATVAYSLAFVYDLTQGTRVASSALTVTGSYLKEMLQVMPAVFILTALISTWVSRDVISAHLGSSSGMRGRLASVAIGSISAGPIYAAFPIAQTLMHKGASIGNVVIIISSWAVIKIPMLAVEARFLGPRFTLLRYLWTVPSILLIGAICNRVLAGVDQQTQTADPASDAPRLEERILQELPRLHCKACGYDSCQAYAEAVAQGSAGANGCVPGGKQAEKGIAALLSS